MGAWRSKMAGESKAEVSKATVFETCEEMGEAAVLADLDRAGGIIGDVALSV